ncbi:exonuclease domain-containing protein [Aliiglaciecola sp. 2_MG-2023]|uniref:exonuclease domain-containing protein n=1 Tax=Alteromonadaceae TaxID=72275 RepID=UPI0026E3AABA|nr:MULTISPECIES: exonuclease domain-containing protein [unclassified Aliiglaciecola]MDO6713124.1 exonuclease domain-containing protein [Aliiglaciecola sp. 2_MG-2023]MDO6754202.1 exonuclease domain-containing protein [Aliiglaciecola sp. 1_MG-2023]
MKELPSKYYLTHFHEFLAFVSGPCAHLLSIEDSAFIGKFHTLCEDAQCLYVRGLNRKSPIIRRNSLFYDEINDHQLHLERLITEGFYTEVKKEHLAELTHNLTKPELAQVLRNANVSFKSSQSKADYLQLVNEFCQFEDFCAFLDPTVVLHRGQDQHINYFLFLFFGDLNSNLSKFSMRDLGIMPTQRGVSTDNARFDFIDEAKSAFFYAHQRREVMSLLPEQQIALAQQFPSFPTPQGTLANEHCDRFLLRLGKAILPHDQSLGIKLLAASSEPLAQEKVIREKYKLGEKEWVKNRLEMIIEEPDSEVLLSFAEDFLARKFQQKRTSTLTDMLREQSTTVLIDEMYMDSVEHGVKLFYQKQKKQAFRTENRLWRALFGLVFWHELFEMDSNALVTEFDYKPQAINQNNFYNLYEQDIETRLYRMTSAQITFKQVSKVMLEKYGRPNGIFRWHKSLLEVLAVFFDHVDIEGLKEHLRMMAKDFKNYADGYPDIMVVDNTGLRFEEIKAPGDQLRKNQLLTIKLLRKSGFKVAVTQVEWFLDPLQPYAVVDIETTGGRANQHRITEIGIAKVVNGKVIDTWQTLINPQRHIPQKITQLTGIDDEMVSDAPLFVEIAENLRSYLSDCVFVAHNVNFDYGFIRAEFERLEQSFRMPKLCTVREMRKAIPGLPSYSLANLTRHFGIDMTRHHRALSDAQAAAELLFIINEVRHEKANGSRLRG